MRYVLSAILLAFTLAPSLAGAQDDPRSRVKVTVERLEERGQGFYEVRADAFVPAPPQAVWKVLTDYDRFHQFVPGMLSSKVIARNEQETILEQEGRVAVLFFSRKIHLVVRVIEHSYLRIDIGLVSGDMKLYESHWELIEETQNGIAGTRINYGGRLEPDFFMPSMFGGAMIKSDGEQMLAAVVAEIGKSNPP